MEADVEDEILPVPPPPPLEPPPPEAGCRAPEETVPKVGATTTKKKKRIRPIFLCLDWIGFEFLKPIFFHFFFFTLFVWFTTNVDS